MDARTLVEREVICCVSSLVATLAAGYGAGGFNWRSAGLSDMHDLCEQAAELCYPVLDYEEAARQSGFTVKKSEDSGKYSWFPEPATRDDETWGWWSTEDEAWEACCDTNRIDPYEWEVYEHWVVTPWLAEKLCDHGQRVGELGELHVWARTTTGQAIYLDRVFQKIVDGIR